MKSLSVKNQELPPLASTLRNNPKQNNDSRILAGNLVGRVASGLLGFLLLGGVAWAQTPHYYDANKPADFGDDDSSCWIATGANMMAADGWGGNAQGIYDYLRTLSSPGLPGTSSNYWNYNAYSLSAVTLMLQNPNTNVAPTPDNTEKLSMYWWTAGGTNGSCNIDPRTNSQYLVNYTYMAPTNVRATMDNILTNGISEAVGIRIWNLTNYSDGHYITVWGELPGGYLIVTDSDDGKSGTNYAQWVKSTINVDGTNYNCDGLDYGGSIDLVNFLTDLSEVPEPESLSLAGLGLAAMAWRVFRRKKNSVTGLNS